MSEASRWSKASVGISVLSLLVAAAAPFVSYYWLDPKIQELKHRPRLTGKETEMHFDNYRHFGLRLKNEGDMPANNVKAVFKRLCPEAAWPADPKVEIDPPSPFKADRSTDRINVLLERPIGQGESVTIHFWVDVPRGAKGRAAVSFAYYDQGQVGEIEQDWLPAPQQKYIDHPELIPELKRQP
jgi:hypothetical protein